MMESPGPVVRCQSCDFRTPVDCPAQFAIKLLELHSISTHGSPPISARCTSCEYVTRSDVPSQFIIQLLGIHIQVCSSTSGDMDNSSTSGDTLGYSYTTYGDTPTSSTSGDMHTSSTSGDTPGYSYTTYGTPQKLGFYDKKKCTWNFLPEII